MSRTGWIVIGLMVLGAGYLVYGRLFSGHGAGDMGMGGAMPVLVANVESTEYLPTVVFTGRLQATSSAEVRPQVAGTLEAIHFKEGQMVKAGDKLFTIDVRTFKATAAQGQAALTQAKQAFERGLKLREVEAISAADMEARTALYKAAQAANTQAQVNLDHAELKAPISGRVGRADVTVGNVVQPGNGPALTTIQTIDLMYVDFEANEQVYLQLLQMDSSGTLNLRNADVAVGLASDGTDFPLRGKLSAVDNKLDTNTGALRLRATIDNPNGSLLPGLFARVQLTVPTSQTAVLVNDAAIVTDQANRMVWKMGADNKQTPQVVTLGPVVDGLRVVTSGLQAGDRVIVNGLMRVRPGAPLLPMPADMRTLKPISPTTPPADATGA